MGAGNSCDFAARGDAFNEMDQAFGPAGNLNIRYGWDGVSNIEDEGGCNGPLIRVRATNNNPETWYAHFLSVAKPGRPVAWRRIVLDPGVTRTYNAQQLANAGFADYADLANLYLTLDPNPPFAL